MSEQSVFREFSDKITIIIYPKDGGSKASNRIISDRYSNFRYNTNSYSYDDCQNAISSFNWKDVDEPSISEKDDIPILHPKEQIAYLKNIIGFKVSEIASILLVERQTVYNWLNSSDLRNDNQDRIDDIYRICAEWEKQVKIENLDFYLRRKIYQEKSLLDLLTMTNLDLNAIKQALGKSQEAMKQDDFEKERHMNFIKKHGLEEDSKKRRRRAISMHRSIG